MRTTYGTARRREQHIGQYDDENNIEQHEDENKLLDNSGGSRN